MPVSLFLFLSLSRFPLMVRYETLTFMIHTPFAILFPIVNKQLNDKERVHAALENTHLLGVVEGCLASAGNRGAPVDRQHE